ncbi:MAG: MBL fold metallo-hydrolase [Planctomycetes bacterium]|nr:MBL fold metallo-hydrolase [Planctomycetota bacterium]
MKIQQFYLGCLAQASYVVVDESTKQAVVIDPRRDVEPYLEYAAREGASIRWVFLTHLHADFVAGHLELRERCGAAIHVSAQAGVSYEHTPVHDGDELVFGNVRLHALETPGHTPESLCIVAYDRSIADDVPHAVFTGDTLFIGDVGRPDLMASVGVTAQELAEQLHRSLHEKLMTLPDETLVYPAHGAGSMCGKNLSSDTVSTIGKQRITNYALQPMDPETFVATVTSDQPQVPRYFAFDAQLNKRDRETLTAALERGLRALDLDAFLREREAGAIVLDTRDAERYAEGHLARSLNVGLDGKFATWVGTIVAPGSRLLVIASPGKEREVVTRLGRIGFDDVAGYLAGGFDALERRPELLTTVERLDVPAMRSLVDASDDALIVDVRTPGEYADGHVPGSANIPLNALQAHLEELPRGRAITLICRSGYRSMVAASLLHAAGHGPLSDLRGGWLAWSGEVCSAGS